MPATKDQREAIGYSVTRVFCEDKRLLKWTTWNEFRIEAEILPEFQKLGLKRPFWQKPETYFVQTLLSFPDLFKAFALRVELTACVAGEHFYWNGCGQRRGFNTASQFAHLTFVPGDDCFLTINVTAIYARLIDILARPERAKPTCCLTKQLTPEATTLFHETAAKQDIDNLGERSSRATQAARIQEMLAELTDESVESLNAIAEYRKGIGPRAGIESDPPSGRTL